MNEVIYFYKIIAQLTNAKIVGPKVSRVQTWDLLFVCVSFMWYLPFYLQTKKKKLDMTINGLRQFKHQEKYMISLFIT
jgi:hypothetical protein